MTVTSADLSQWAAHRRAVVLTVSRRVPGIDPELATSRGLELLCVELLKQGDVADPIAFWSAASVDAALEMAHEEALPDGQVSGREVVTAPVRRALDLEVLTTAMERLPAGDQQLLWDHHVGSRPVAAIADEIGVLPYAAKRRLRRAENRLASSFAETHTGAADNLECESTRASMHDFVRNRLLPRRRQKVEDHMVQCAGCTRAFVDVRESYWMLRAAAPVLLLGAMTASHTGAAMVATGAGAATSAGLGGGLAALGARVALTVRTALTDPISLTATVAGGLVLTTAVTTGVSHDAGAVAAFFETGIVSVSGPEERRTVVRGARPTSHAEDPTNLPETTRFVPPGLAKDNGVPPGLAAKDGVPPGLARTDEVPPGQADEAGGPAESAAPDAAASPGPTAGADGTPPGQATDEGTPPGLAKKDGVPPGLAKNGGVPPGQAKKDEAADDQAAQDGTPPGQAKKDSAADETAKDRTPPGQAKKDGTPPGASGAPPRPPGPPDHARSSRTSTS